MLAAMQQSTTLTERKMAKTRDRLIATAMRLFAEKGYEATTVEEIAADVEVSRRTFFRYFANKEAIVFPDHQRRLTIFRESLKTHCRELPPFDAVRETCLDFARLYTDERDELLAQYQVVKTSKVLQANELEFDLEYETAIAEVLLDKGHISRVEEYRRRALAGAIFGAIRATLRTWFAGGCRQDLVKLGEQAFDLLARGAGNRPGAKKRKNIRRR